MQHERRPTVPDELVGCWQRAWIEHADGTRDDTSLVIWLQLPSDMADVRLPCCPVLYCPRVGSEPRGSEPGIA